MEEKKKKRKKHGLRSIILIFIVIYGFVQFYGNFIKGSILTAIMITWRFITYYIPMVVGAIAFNIRKRNDKK